MSPSAFAPPMGATFSPIVRLTPRTPSSYAIALGTADMVAAHLARQGWRRFPGHSDHEVARLRDAARGLIVLYPRTALVQGQAEAGHAVLAELVEVQHG